MQHYNNKVLKKKNPEQYRKHGETSEEVWCGCSWWDHPF